MYDFDKIVDRSGSGAIKYDMIKPLWGRDDLIPLWVADMDFETPPFIVEALKARMEHPVFGYTTVPEGYWQCIAKWIKDHHQWDVKTEWMTYIPGIVKGIGMVVNVFTEPDDKVMILSPVYHPFRITPEGNRREVVQCRMRELESGLYDIDYDQLEEHYDEHCKLLILSNPHNPAGICWTREQLLTLSHWCKDHNILVISDEIHCDMALFGHKHIPFASVSDEAAHNSITFSAPSKTFNIAGIVSSWCVVPDDAIRQRFFGWIHANEFEAPHLFAPIATMAAFTEGEEWRQQMVKYIEGNVELVENYCREHLPFIKPLRPQASFLIWLDCRELARKLEECGYECGDKSDAPSAPHGDKVVDFFVDKAHLAMNDGAIFGPGGENHMRMNIGCPRSVIQKALEQIRSLSPLTPSPLREGE